MNRHYIQQIREQRQTWVQKPGFHDATPYLIAPFTNWEPVRMYNAVEFAMKNDPVKLDFEADCVADLTVNPLSTGDYRNR